MQLTTIRKFSRVLIFSATASFMAASIRPCLAADDYVIIANKANPGDSIRAGDLKAMFMGQKAIWPGGEKVITVTPASESPEYGPMIKKTTGMSPGDYKRYVIQMSFLGRMIPLPRAYATPADIVRYISTAPGAIGCLPAATDLATVKILKVE